MNALTPICLVLKVLKFFKEYVGNLIRIFPYIDFDDDQALVWDLSLPEDVVEGSARAWVTAVGDLMGPALQVKLEARATFLSYK